MTLQNRKWKFFPQWVWAYAAV